MARRFEEEKAKHFWNGMKTTLVFKDQHIHSFSLKSFEQAFSRILMSFHSCIKQKG